jgi:SSS family solute:Na+ symporter
LIGWAVGTIAGTAMAIAAHLMPTYPLAIAGFVFPGYSALYTVILNLVIAVVLTPIFDGLKEPRASSDETVAADYLA